MIDYDKLIVSITGQIAVARETNSNFITLTKGEGKKLLEILAESPSARPLSWHQVIKLPPDQKAWIQYGDAELEKDALEYNAETDEMTEPYFMSIWTKASETYDRCWVAWDKLPTEKQMKEVAEKWKRH